MTAELSPEQREAIDKLARQIAAADGSSFAVSKEDEAKAPIRNKALRLLDQRSRSKAELRQRLLQVEEFSPALIEEVLEALAEARLLDDHVFAHEWVRQRSALRKRSKAVLDRELIEKGVAEELRREALAQITEEDEVEMARALAEKKAKSVKAIPVDYAARQKDLRKVVGVLARRGFAQGMSMRIAKQALAARYEQLGADEQLSTDEQLGTDN